MRHHFLHRHCTEEKNLICKSCLYKFTDYHLWNLFLNQWFQFLQTQLSINTYHIQIGIRKGTQFFSSYFFYNCWINLTQTQSYIVSLYKKLIYYKWGDPFQKGELSIPVSKLKWPESRFWPDCPEMMSLVSFWGGYRICPKLKLGHYFSNHPKSLKLVGVTA